MSDFYIDVKNRDGIPAGNLSVLRGRGPRRGNLEQLLDYWRGIMKKPGGFRRCIVILADHPELYPLEPLCAWLHHETTGKWPGEGRGRNGGGRRGGGRRRRRRKGEGQTHILVKPTVERRVINTQLPLDVKTGLIRSNTRTGRAVQSAGSVILPGDLSDFRSPVRSAIFEALTPGFGRDDEGNVGLSNRRSRARNQFRCPPGFEKGGTFTNSSFSTCGLQVLSIPETGPGSLSQNAAAAVRTLAEDASLVRKIGDLSRNSNSAGIVRASQIPPAPKEVAVQARQRSVDLIVEKINSGEEKFGSRFVRRDGIILEPSQSLQTISSLGEFDDMNDGVLIFNDADRSTTQIGQNEVPTLSTGLRALIFQIPEVGSFSIRRDGGDLDESERLSIRRRWSAALQSTSRQTRDPSAAIRRFVESSDGRFVIDENITKEESEFDRELVVVESGSTRITVPRWVFSVYLSRTAPRRVEGEPAFTLVEESNEKGLERYAFARKSVPIPDAAAYTNTEYYDWLRGSVSHFRDWTEQDEKRLGINLRGIRRRGRGRGAGAIFDSGSNRFRCPVGTANGGQFTDRTAASCGARISPNVIDALYGIAGLLEIPEADVGKGKDRNIGQRSVKAQAVVADLKKKGINIDDVLLSLDEQILAIRKAAKEARENRGPGGSSLGQTIGQQSQNNAPTQLNLFDRVKPNVEKFEADILDLEDIVDDDIVQNDGDEHIVLELFGKLEDVANTEAIRKDAFPDRSPEDAKRTGRIASSINSITDGIRRLAGRLADAIDVSPEDRAAIDDRRAARQVERAARRESRRAARTARRANRAAGRARFFQRFTNAVDDPLNPRNRRDKVDLPELQNLNEAQQNRLEASMLRHWEELDLLWSEKLGIDEPDYEQIADWVRKNDDPTGVWDARRNNWLELYSALAEEREDDRPFDDFVGRLTPSARQDVIRNANLSATADADRARQERLNRILRQREAAAAEAVRRERIADQRKREDREAQEAREARRRALEDDRRRNREERQALDKQRIERVEGRYGSRDHLQDGILPEGVNGIFAPVEKNDSQYKTVDQAVEALNNGAALGLIPDDFLAEAIQKSDRFIEIGRTEEGVNGIIRYQDARDGSLYGLKFSSGRGLFEREGDAEIMGAGIADALGFQQGAIRWAGPELSDTEARVKRNTRPILVQFAQNYNVDPKQAYDRFGNEMGGPRIAQRLLAEDPLAGEQLLAMNMLDAVIANGDRHTKNWMVGADNEIIPIDMGGAFGVPVMGDVPIDGLDADVIPQVAERLIRRVSKNGGGMDTGLRGDARRYPVSVNVLNDNPQILDGFVGRLANVDIDQLDNLLDQMYVNDLDYKEEVQYRINVIREIQRKAREEPDRVKSLVLDAAAPS